MDQYLYSKLIAFLKKQMKAKKISYALLANKIEVPVSTLKKWFLAEDGSINKLSKICSALDLSLQDAIKAVEQTQVQTLKMPKKVQEYFLKDSRAFKIYWCLVYGRQSEETVIRKLKISSEVFGQYLLAFERLSLLQMDKNTKIKLPQLRPVRWQVEGVFLKKILRDWAQQTLQDSFEANSEDNFVLQYFQLGDNSFQELRADLLKLEEKYARRTIFELSTSEETLQKIRFLNTIQLGDFLDL